MELAILRRRRPALVSEETNPVRAPTDIFRPGSADPYRPTSSRPETLFRQVGAHFRSIRLRPMRTL